MPFMFYLDFATKLEQRHRYALYKVNNFRLLYLIIQTYRRILRHPHLEMGEAPSS